MAGTGVVPDFSNRRSTEAWFRSQRPKVVMVLAARAALRMLPLLAIQTEFDLRDAPETTNLIHERTRLQLIHEFTQKVLAVFRAAALAALGAKELQPGKRFMAAAVDAAATAFDVAEEMYAGAADAAYVAQIALECTSSTGPSDLASAAADYSGIDLTALSNDAAFVDRGRTPAERDRLASELLGRPLWFIGIPDSAANLWASLKWVLPKHENWSVWFDWYEEYQAGAHKMPRLETVLLDIEDRLWDDNSAGIINAAIAALLKEGSSEDDVPKPAGYREQLPGPTPIVGVLSPVDFVFSPAERIRAVPSGDVQPILKTSTDRQDHRPRLDLCRSDAQSLLDLINQRTVNVRGGYARALKAYFQYLPTSTRKRNLLLADQEA
jgi:hypothetical protein